MSSLPKRLKRRVEVARCFNIDHVASSLDDCALNSMQPSAQDLRDRLKI
jgi:hypothetical protein